MTQEELRRYTIPVKYNGMIIGGDIVEYPKTINVTAICIDAHSGETGLACTTNKDRREYTDLSQLWHPLDFKSKHDVDIAYLDIVATVDNEILREVTTLNSLCNWLRYNSVLQGRVKWAFWRDLLPKGGE